MSNYQPFKGDYVRVTVEDKVKWTHSGGGFTLASVNVYPAVAPPNTLTVEKIDPPVPPLPTTFASVIRRKSDGEVFSLRVTGGFYRSDVGALLGPVRPPVADFEILFDAGKK